MNKLIEAIRGIKEGNYDVELFESDHSDKELVNEFNSMVRSLQKRNSYVNNEISLLAEHVEKGLKYPNKFDVTIFKVNSVSLINNLHLLKNGPTRTKQ